MTNVILEIGVIMLLLIGNGYLALSDIAIVSSRRTRLVQRAERGDAAARGGARALARGGGRGEPGTQHEPGGTGADRDAQHEGENVHGRRTVERGSDGAAARAAPPDLG